MPKTPATTPSISLADYVAQNKPHRCWVCRHPMREELDSIYRNNGRDSIAPMVRWLQKAGHTDATDSKLRHHFVTYRHHEQKDD
jgi:hypothetical protein